MPVRWASGIDWQTVVGWKRQSSTKQHEVSVFFVAATASSFLGVGWLSERTSSIQLTVGVFRGHQRLRYPMSAEDALGKDADLVQVLQLPPDFQLSFSVKDARVMTLVLFVNNLKDLWKDS